MLTPVQTEALREVRQIGAIDSGQTVHDDLPMLVDVWMGNQPFNSSHEGAELRDILHNMAAADDEEWEDIQPRS